MPSIDLVKLYIDRFGSYDKLELSLKDLGAVYINGPIGSGKSTIPFAIYYLLTGKMIRKKSEFVSVKDFANKVYKDGYDVALDFTTDNHECRIREIRDRGAEDEMEKDGLYFFVDGEDKRGKTDQETRNNITRFIKVSDDLSNLAFLSGRQTQKLIHGTSAERARVIVDVFGLERYNEMIESCSKELGELESSRKSLGEKIEFQQSLIDSLTEDLSNFGELGSAEEIDESRIDLIAEKIREIEDKLEKINEKEKEAREFIAKAEEINKHKKKLGVLNLEIEELEAQLRAMPDLPDLSVKDKLNKRKEEKKTLIWEIKSSKQELEKIKKLKNLCPINEKDCPVNVPKKHKAARIGECERRIKTDEKELSQINDKIDSLSEKVDIVEDIEDLKSHIGEKVKLRKFVDVQGVDQDEIEEKNDLLEKCEDGKERGEQKLEELRETRSDLKSKIDLIKQREMDMKNLRASLDEARSKLGEHKGSLEEFSISIQYVNGALNIFRRAKIYKIKLVLDFLNESVNGVLHEISGGERSVELVSQRKSKKSKIAMDKLGIMVSDSYKTLPIELVSDGQETQVGVSVLFGVWKTANDLSNKKICFLWLDEVFGPLDNDTIERVFETVVRLSKEIGTKSIYVISHRDLDCRLFDWEWRAEFSSGVSSLSISQLN